MAEIEIGRGRALQDHLNVKGIVDYDCYHCAVFRDDRFECIKHNGTMTVLVYGGMHSGAGGTVDEFKEMAECCKNKSGK